MSTGKMHLEVKGGIVTGPPGLSILEVRLKERLPNGDKVYNIIREDSKTIGEFTIEKGEQGIPGSIGLTGATGVGINNITHTKEGLTNKIMIHLTDSSNYPMNILDGESAYGLWQNDGNEGELNDFFEAYRGYSLQYLWRGTELGIKIENQSEYTFVNLKGDIGATGSPGKNLEFHWQGSELGIRTQGQSEYKYVDLRGPEGDTTNNIFKQMVDSEYDLNKNVHEAKVIRHESTGLNTPIMANYGTTLQLTGGGDTGAQIFFPYGTNRAFFRGYNFNSEGIVSGRKNWFEVYHTGNFDPNSLNICPYRIGDILITTSDIHPALTWAGTEWSKIEERFLYGTNGISKQLGGKNNINLTIRELPKHTHSAWTDQQGNHNHVQDAHVHTQPAHGHTYRPLAYGGGWYGQGGNLGGFTTENTGAAGGENTGGAQPGISYTGQHGHNVGIGETGIGEEISIMPQYYTVNIWERIH